jgi:hypothetical protein
MRPAARPGTVRPPASTSPDAVPTRAAFIRQGDRICDRANDEIAPLNEQYSRITETAASEDEALAAVAPLLERGYAAMRTAATEFGRLDPPSVDREIADEMTRTLDEQAALLGRTVDAAHARDMSRFRSFSEELERTAIRSRGLMQGYGFRRCGRGTE